MNIERITFERLLPSVFVGMEGSIPIKESKIWDVAAFSIEKGCKLCIHSESGGGKSSLLSFIYGNRADYVGKILFNKTNIKDFTIPEWCEIRRRHIALLPQEMRLFPELTVLDNIQLKNNLSGWKTVKEIEGMLADLGVADKLNTPVAKLSIGQQQRVAIVRTLCQPFDFIFLDEPVSHLDETNNKIVAELVDSEAKKNNAGIITTSVGNHLLLDSPQFVNL